MTESPADEGLPVQSESLPGQQSLPIEPAPKRSPTGKLTPRPGLVDWLKSMDTEAFLDDWPIKEMRRRIDAKYGTTKRTRVSAAEFAEARLLAFDKWRAVTLFAERKLSLLDEEGWMKIHRAFEELRSEMFGRTLRQCVRIMRTKVACNETILRGLPTRFHVWKKG